MKYIILSSFLITSCFSESNALDFKTKGFIGLEINQAASAIGQLYNDPSCKPNFLKKLESRFGPSPQCYKTKDQLIGGGRLHEIFTSDNVVKEYRVTWYDSTPRRNNFKVFPQVKSVFGEHKPTYIKKQNAKYGNFPAYTATWETDQGIAHAFAICPLMPIGNERVETKHLKDCALQKVVFQDKIKEPLNEQFKGNEKTY